MEEADARRVVATAGCGFVVESERGPGWRVESDGDGWRVHGLSGRPDATLRRARQGSPGFVLEDGGEEAARTSTPPGVGVDAGLRHLLLADGRLFRLAPSLDGTVRLLGWEAPGAFLSANRKGGCWNLVAEPAGDALERMDDLGVMMAAELMDYERTAEVEE